jgi:diamine N-acetyltransferase
MAITIRKAAEADFGAVLNLIKGLAVFQGMPEKVTNTVELMKEEKGYFQCLVAENESGEIIGIATYFYAYYTWSGKSLYLDDLYVKEESRGLKAGTMLLDELFEIAKKENCKRVRWMVSNWNKPAIEFYKKCGADIDEELFICDFDSHGIESYLNRKR